MLPNFDNDIQNPLLDSLRKKIEDKFGVDTSEISNEQLLFKHGQDLQNAGYTMTTMRDKLGDEFTDQYFDIKNRPQPDQGYLGEIGSGFKEQGYGLLGMPFQAAGLVAGATGDALGVDLGVEDYLMQKGSDIAAKGQEDPRTIQSIDDVRWDNPSEIARYLLGGIGASAPSVLESATAFTGAGGVGYALAKSKAKKALAETIKNKGAATADERVKDVFQELVKQRAKQGFNTGAQVGLGVSSIGLGVGEIYGELYQYTQLDPSDPEYVNPSTARALSTSFGTLAGGLDMMGAGKLLSRMTGMSETKAQGYFTRLLRGLPEGIVIEGGTEVVQEILNLAAEKYAKGEELEFTDQEIMRMIDAGVLGAIGGTGFSAIGAIPGPKKKQEPEVGSQEIASESKEVQAQKELLANIKGESTEVRYKKGDKVQTAYGDKGVVRDSRAEDSTVEFADGTVRDVRNDRLAEALEPPPVEPTPVPEKTDQPQAESTEVVPEPIKEPIIPQYEEPSTDEVFVSVSGINENEVNVTPQTQEDIKKLLKHYRSWQKEDMYTMRGRAGKAGKGWDSSDFGRMEIKLGPDRALIIGKRGARNKAALKELGYLDNNGNWYKETPADRAFVKDQERVLKEGRLKVVDENKEWLAPGKKVKRVGTKLLGVIDKIDKDGFVVIGDERYNPIHLYPVREPKVRNLPPPSGGQVGGGATDTSHLEFIASDLEVKGNDVEYFYKQGDGRISRSTKKLGQFKDLDALRTGLLEMLAKYKVQKKSAVVNALKVAIGKEEFRIDTDKDSGDYNFGAFEITQEEVDQAIIEAKRKIDEGGNKDSAPAQRTTLDEPIEVASGRAGGSDEQYPNSVFDENGDTPFDMFVGKIDIDDIVGEDGNVRRDTYDEENLDKISAGKNVDQISKSAALLILKKGKKLRIVSAGLTDGGQVRVYDSEIKGKALRRYIDVYAIEEKGWKVVGKLLTNKIGEHKKTGKKVRLPSPYIDVIYQSEKQFNEDDDLVKAMEQIDANEKDSKQAAQTKQIIKEKEEAKANNARIKKDIADKIAEIQSQLGERSPDLQFSKSPEYLNLSNEDQQIAYEAERIIENYNSGTYFDGEKGRELYNMIQTSSPKFSRVSMPIAVSKEVDSLTIEYVVEKARTKLEQKINSSKLGDTQGSALSPEDQDVPKATKEELLAQLEQLKQQLAYLEEQDKVSDIAIKTEQAKYQAIRKGEALQANAVREGVDGKPEGEGEGFTTSEAMLKNNKVGDVSKIWTSYLHTLSIAKFEYILDFNKTVPPGGSKRAENRVKIFQSVGRASGAKEFFSLVTDMLGGAETGRKDLLKAYADSDTLFDKFLTALYQRLINDNATKAYVKNKEMVTDPMADPALAKKLKGLLRRYFKGRQDVILKTVDAMAYDQARRGDDVDVFMQEAPSPLEKVGLTAEAVKAMTGGKPTELTALPDPEPDPEEETVVSKSDQFTTAVQKIKKIIADADLPLPNMRDFTDAVKRVEIGSLVNLSPDELFQVVAEELVIQLNIRDEFKTQTELNDFADLLQGRITEEEITLLFDKEGSKIGVADEQGLQLDEGYKLDHNNVDEGRLNPNRSRIPIIDPTTGQREITQTGTTSNEAIDHSYEEARRDPRRYMAPKENPVSKYPGRVEEAQAAMRRFAPLEGAPFTAKTAINQIINQFPHLPYVSNVARMLSDNKFLDGYSVELVPWEQYRPYARVNGTLTRAVHIPSKKKIIISDAYWGKNETLKSDEALAAVILHELLHPSLNPILAVGQKLALGQEVETDAKTKEVASSLMSSMEKLMPYLKERSAGDLKLQYGLTSIDEFFSVFASDPYFRDFLSRTPLPKSMQKTGVMQTILDFIYRILAKLNFATAQTDSALDYATEQLGELIEASQSMSHALDANGNPMQPSALDPAREKLSASEAVKQRQKEKKLYRQKVDELRAEAEDSFSRILLGKKLPVAIVNADLGPMISANREITKTLIKRISQNPSLIEIENNNSPEVLKVLKVIETYKRKLQQINNQDSQRKSDFVPLIVSDFILDDKSFIDVSTIDESLLKKLREQLINRSDHTNPPPSAYLRDVTGPINAFHDNITKVLKHDLDFYNQFKSRGTEDGDIKAEKMLNAIIERIGDIEIGKAQGARDGPAQEALNSLNPQGVIDGILDKLHKIKTQGSGIQGSAVDPSNIQGSALDPALQKEWSTRGIHITYLDNLESVASGGLRGTLPEGVREQLESRREFLEHIRKPFEQFEAENKALFYLAPHSYRDWDKKHKRNIEFVVSETGGVGGQPKENVEDIDTSKLAANMRRKKAVIGIAKSALDRVYSERDDAMADYFQEAIDLPRRTNQAQVAIKARTPEEMKRADKYYGFIYDEPIFKPEDLAVWTAEGWVPIQRYLPKQNIQASAIDTEFNEGLRSEGPYFYREVLNDISEKAKQGSTEYNIIQAINILRGGQEDGSQAIRPPNARAVEIDTEAKERLKDFARASVELIDEAQINDELEWGQKFSGEHDVYFDDGRQRYVKAYKGTWPFGVNKLTEYLERLLLHNYYFPEVRIELDGFVERFSADSKEIIGRGLNSPAKDMLPVISQEAIVSDSNAPTPLGVINTAMLKKGFRNQGIIGSSGGEPYNTYLRGSVRVRDLSSRNAIIQNGVPYLFDPYIDKSIPNSIDTIKSEIDIVEKIIDGNIRNLVKPLVSKYKERFNVSNKEDALNQLESLQQELDYIHSEDIQASALDNGYTEGEFDESITANPDENMRVMMESNAAGFNEMVTELVKVYQQIGGEELGMDLETFLDQFGSPSSTNISTIKKRLEKDLSPFMDSIEDVRLDNAGLNRIAFNWGRRKGVANLESVRTKARKELQNRILAEEMSEKAIIASMRTYEDLEKGRFPPIEKQIESILTKANQVKFDTLVEYVTSLPNASLTQADIRAAQELSKADIEQVMELLIEVPGEAETLKKVELMDQIKGLGIPSLSGDNKTHAVKRMAIMRAIRESKGQMALYRLSKGKIGGDQKAMLKVGRQIASAPDLKTLGNIVIQPGVKGTPFRHFADLKEAELTERENLEDIKKEQQIYSKIDLGIKARSDVLRASLGELQPVSIHDGASILTMEWDDKNAQWKRGENFKVQIRNGKLVDRAQFVKVNRETLRFINDPESKKEFGEEPWFDLMREQALLAMAEPIGEEYFHVQRASWISGLQGLTERFAKMGYDGMKLSQMSSQTVALFRDYSSKSQALSLQFNASAQRLMGALKVGGREFYSGIYQDIWWWFDNHPEFAGNEEQAFAELWKYLRRGANIPDRTLLDDNARRLTKDLVAKTLSARDFEKSVNLQLGNRIKDDEFKVQSYIDGELVDFYRDPMDIGYATMPRSINNGVVIDTNAMMQRLGWRGEAGNELIAEAQSAKDLDTMSKIYNRMFTEEVVEKFLKPFLHSDVRQSTFRGPSDVDGHNAYLGNTFIRESFRASGGDVQKMTDIIFDRVSIDTTLEARLIWKYYFLRQVDNKYRELKKVADQLEQDKVEQGLHDSHLMRNTPQSLDSRMMESRLPKEFFYYTMYDEVTSSIRLALQVATKTFGRQGDKAQRAFKGGRATFERARSEFNVLMSKATNGKHEAPWKHYSRADKKEAYRLLRKDGDSNPEKTWNELYSKSVALGEMNRAMEHLARYYGKDNAAGPYKDANLLLELLGVQALSVLNNPKSSFWQNLGLFEFPMAFRGLNKMAGKGTAAALGNFVNQTFGGMVESMGVELDKTGRYAQYLNNTHFRLDEMDLDFKTYVGAQLGSGGELSGHEPRKYLRMAKRAMMFNKRKNVDGTRAPFDWLTVLKGIFPYTNNVVNHSIGVGAIHAYNDLILQASEEIQRRGITEYNGELSAQDLGMGDKLGETFIGEADGYRRMNELLISHGLPSVTRMAFDFIDRKKIDKNAFPIERNAALLINTIAMDQISGDGFNAKPAWLYSSEYLRYFNTFLGWPLGKMGRDLSAVIRDGDDPTTTYIALMKYIGLLTAVYMPMSLSFGMMIDWYDEEMLEKPNNLPPITPWAALPIVGIPIAATDPNFTIYSVTSRIAKAGVPFGMGTELLNGIFSKGDPYGASRELSLDSRIFMFSMFKNIYDAMGTWIHQGEWDWETVGRPIAYGVGGNSVIQMMDLATAQFDIDNEERRVADYIGLKNTIKKSAFMMGLELRPPFKGGGRPTGVSVNTRQMARAAYAGDSQEFLLQYQQALEAAREDGREDPERAVIDSYKTRSLRHGITKTKMTDAEWNRVMSVLDDEDRMRVMQAVSAHEHYLRLMGGSRRPKTIKRTIDVNRALAASLLIQ